MKNLPRLKKSDLDKSKDDTWDYLFHFIDAYYKILDADPTGDVFDEFSTEQHTLLAYNTVYGEVTNGGFLQLIQNGYGAFIFEDPFAENIELWGAKETAKIVNQAKLIYDKNKDDLEKETTIEEFSEMYKQYPEFEPLDDQFYDIMDNDVEIVRKYVENNILKFAVIE